MTLGAALLCFVAASASADVHYFKAQIIGTGSATADYGRDGKNPNLTTAAGVDGKETIRWRWEDRAVAESIDNGPLLATAEVARERAVLEASVVSYSVHMGVYHDDSLCTNLQGKTTILSYTPPGRLPRKSSKGDFRRHPLSFAIRGFGLAVALPWYEDYASLNYCVHGISGHGLKFLAGARGNQAPVPRGAFNSRFDRSFSHTYRDSSFLGRAHGGDPNSAHTFKGESELDVRINSIAKWRYRRLGRKYHRAKPANGVSWGYHDP